MTRNTQHGGHGRSALSAGGGNRRVKYSLLSGAVALVVVGGWFYLHRSGDPQVPQALRDATSEVSKAGDSASSSLKVGDCYRDQENTKVITDVTAVPCDQAHTAQVYGSFQYTLSDAPALTDPTAAQTKVDAAVDANCPKSRGAVDDAKLPAGTYDDSLSPEEADVLPGSYQILCTVVADSPWTGSAMK